VLCRLAVRSLDGQEVEPRRDRVVPAAHALLVAVGERRTTRVRVADGTRHVVAAGKARAPVSIAHGCIAAVVPGLGMGRRANAVRYGGGALARKLLPAVVCR
jgi:hypothetical protein